MHIVFLLVLSFWHFPIQQAKSPANTLRKNINCLPLHILPTKNLFHFSSPIFLFTIQFCSKIFKLFLKRQGTNKEIKNDHEFQLLFHFIIPLFAFVISTIKKLILLFNLI